MRPADPTVHHLTTAAGRTAFTDQGAGPPVVALHGLPGSSRDFRWLGGPAAAAGVRLVCLDLPGFGQSTIREPLPLWPALVGHVSEVVREIVAGPFVVLGHSMGTALALEVAATDPAARGLVLLAPVGLRPHRTIRRLPRRALARGLRIPPVAAVLKPLFRFALRRSGFPPTPDAQADRVLELLAFYDPARVTQALDRLAVPVFGAWTHDDERVEAEISAELLAACPEGPRLRFPTGGHNLQKTRAAEIAEALAAFSEGLDLGSRSVQAGDGPSEHHG